MVKAAGGTTMKGIFTVIQLFAVGGIVLPED